MAYVLGYFAADGSMIRTSRGGYYIEFTTTDRSILTQLKSVIASNHTISKRPLRNANWKPQYRLQLGSKAWFNDLEHLGFSSNKSNSMTFPHIPGELLADFVRGYFDGDGCVYCRQHFAKDRQKLRWVFAVRFTSGSERFLLSLLQRLHVHSICKGGFILQKHNKRGYELVFSHRDGLALSDFMYHNSSRIYLRRKYITFQKAAKVLSGS